MSLNQTIQCPACGGPITFNVKELLAGASFQCPRCTATIRMSPSHQNEVKSL